MSPKKLDYASRLCKSSASGDLGVRSSERSVKKIWEDSDWSLWFGYQFPPLSPIVGPGRVGKKNVLKSVEMTCIKMNCKVTWHQYDGSMTMFWITCQTHVTWLCCRCPLWWGTLAKGPDKGDHSGEVRQPHLTQQINFRNFSKQLPNDSLQKMIQESTEQNFKSEIMLIRNPSTRTQIVLKVFLGSFKVFEIDQDFLTKKVSSTTCKNPSCPRNLDPKETQSQDVSDKTSTFGPWMT